MPDDIDAVTDGVGKVPNHNGAEPDAAAAAVPDHIYTMPRDTGTEPDVVPHDTCGKPDDFCAMPEDYLQYQITE